MKRIHLYKTILISLFVLLSMAGCGGEAEGEAVVIDGQTKTFVNVEKGCTVADALTMAEIEVHENDVVMPELTQTLSGDGDEIVITRYANVEVEEGTKVRTIEKLGGTVKDALDELKITLGKHDYINHDPDALLTEGMHINVCHRKFIKLKVDGKVIKYLTEKTDVQGVLEESGIVLGKNDRVKPALTKKIKDDGVIIVNRVDTREITEKEEIAYGTKKEYSSSMYEGEQKEKTKGVPGEKMVTYRVVFVDGKEESRTVIKEEVIKAPIDRVVITGTKKKLYIVSKQKFPDCDGSNHGYYVITWSDGREEYEEY